MNVREATAADEPTLLGFTRAISGRTGTGPGRPGGDAGDVRGKLVLLAEDEGEPVGYAFGESSPAVTRT